MEQHDTLTKPQVNYDVLFNGRSVEDDWRRNVTLVREQILEERRDIAPNTATQTEKQLAVGINQRVLRESEHTIKEGGQSEHFLQITKTRMALLDALNVHPDAADVVYDNYFTAFASWRADSLQTKDGIKRFFDETQKVGFPKKEVEDRVLLHIGKEIVTTKETRNDILDKRQLKDEQDGKTRIPSYILTAEIAQAMSITEGELNEKVFDQIASACDPKSNLFENMELRSDLGMPATLEVRSVDIDTVVKAGVKLGVSEQIVLNKMKVIWPTPTIADIKAQKGAI